MFWPNGPANWKKLKIKIKATPKQAIPAMVFLVSSLRFNLGIFLKKIG